MYTSPYSPYYTEIEKNVSLHKLNIRRVLQNVCQCLDNSKWFITLMFIKHLRRDKVWDLLVHTKHNSLTFRCTKLFRNINFIHEIFWIIDTLKSEQKFSQQSYCNVHIGHSDGWNFTKEALKVWNYEWTFSRENVFL